MGTDIHGVFERLDKNGKWHAIESRYKQGRDYQLFAVLVGVRNGRGFAGVPTGEAVQPIASPRGLPEAFVEPLDGWMGEHSYSWLMAEEILAWAEAAPEVCKTGILDRVVYEAWDGTSPPTAYSGGIGGRLIVLVNDNAIEKEQTPSWTHIRCHWVVDLKTELSYFFDEVARLVGEHGHVRFVFGFDS